MKNFGVLNPVIEFEIHGFDVNNHGMQSEGYFKNTIELLSEHFPSISWEKRLHVFSAKKL